MNRKVILGANEVVSYPKCMHGFPLEQGISTQAIHRYAREFGHTLSTQKVRADKQSAQRLAALSARVAEAERVAGEIRVQVEKARQDGKKIAREEFETELKSLREANAAKDDALAKARATELDLRRQLREADEGRKDAEVEYQRKLDEDRKRIAEEERAAAGQDADRRIAKYMTQMEQAQRKAADLQRKLDQGSQEYGKTLALSLNAMLREQVMNALG
jgi:hypothetical protein